MILIAYNLHILELLLIKLIESNKGVRQRKFTSIVSYERRYSPFTLFRISTVIFSFALFTAVDFNDYLYSWELYMWHVTVNLLLYLLHVSTLELFYIKRKIYLRLHTTVLSTRIRSLSSLRRKFNYDIVLFIRMFELSFRYIYLFYSFVKCTGIS